MILRVDFELDEFDVAQLQRKGIQHGFTREYPRKSWLAREKKEAVRLAIMKIVSEALEKEKVSQVLAELG